LSVSLKSGERAFAGGDGRFGQHHGQLRHALAVAAGVGRLLVDGEVDQLDEGLEQRFKLLDQLAIAQERGGLRGERFGQALVGVGEKATTAAPGRWR
jgi:hypothetical protein